MSIGLRTLTRIAARNLRRSTRRSLATISAIALGYAAVNVFGGFAEYMFEGLKDAFIYAQADGHLVVFKKGYLTEGQINPRGYLLTKEEIDTLRDSCLKDLHAVVATPKLHLTGMLNNGQVSTIAVIVGIVPSDIKAMQERAPGISRKMKVFTHLDESIGYAVGLGRPLADRLKLDVGAEAVLMTTTLEGQINAQDIKVSQSIDVLNESLSDKLVIAPLSLAQSLFDTDSADRLCVLLRDTAQTDAMKAVLENSAAGAGLPIEVKPWYELSPIYKQTRDAWDTILTFVFIIMLVIVFMSVVNTIGMAVVERTKETGTLRALGLKRRGVIQLFAVESALLGLLGAFAGIVLTVLTSVAVAWAEPSWVPAGVGMRVPLEVHLVPRYLVLSFGLLVCLSIMAAVVTSRKATRQSIVDALGHES